VLRDELDALSILHRRVIVNRAVDPRSHAGFHSDHAALLRDIDGAATVLELISTWGRAGAERALSALRDLHRWGACGLADDGKPARPFSATPVDDEIPIYEDEGVTPHTVERRLLAEENDLDDATRKRILAATTMLRDGRVLELLGVAAGAGRLELKRAYYALAKEFHPDRFYGKQLGSFAPLLSQVFEAAAQAIKTLLDQRTVTRDAASGWPQRRRTPRYAFATPVRMRCESWPSTMALTTRQISAGGMFVGTEAQAAVGERAAFELTLPDQSRLTLSGRVVAQVAGEGARPSGLCVQFAPLADPDRARFTMLLEAARDGRPAPADEPLETIGGRVRFARGSGAHRATAPVIGIDLGTTFVSVSASIDGRVHVLPFPGGARSMPSVVAFPRRGEVLVGNPARERLARDPHHAVASAKRLLGRRADDREIQGQLASAGYATLTGPGGELLLDMWGEPIAIPQLCGYLLDAARVAAESALGRPVGSAVLAVPVSFGPERVALARRAARMAHLEVADVVDEPSAAALANRFHHERGGLVGIYDFGGGTFDFSVVDTSDGDFKVITTAGDSWLGGDDFDLAVAEALANLFWRANGVDLRQRAVEWQQLLFAAERAKRDLSEREETQLVVPDVVRTATGSSDLSARILRGQVEKLWRPLIDRSLNTCLQTLTLVGLRPTDLSAIYLSGGTTHIPIVRKSLHRYFGTEPVTGVPADYAVCLGAGIQAAQIELFREPTLTGR